MNNSWKRVALLAALVAPVAAGVATAAPTAVVQPGQGRGPGGGRGAEMLKDLNLTADQQTKVEALYKAQREKMDAARSANGDDRTKNREAMQAMQADTETQLKGILTPEQYTKYEAKRAEMMKNRPARGGQGAQ